MKLPVTLAIVLLAALSVGCGNPLTISAWLNLEEGSQVELPGFLMPVEGGVFTRIDVDLSDLLHPQGTIQVEQVRIGGVARVGGSVCLRKDMEVETTGSFRIGLLEGTQEVDFPLATITVSSFLADRGFPELRSVASPEGLEFPLDPALFAPIIDHGTIDGVLSLPVLLDQQLELAPGYFITGAVDLLLRSASKPAAVSSEVLAACQDIWDAQGQPLPYLVNSKGTYLHYVNEANAKEPLVIPLADVQAVPGDKLRIRTEGKWDGLFQSNLVRMAAVFSPTGEVRPVDPPFNPARGFFAWLAFRSNRIVNPIEAGTDVVTPLTFAGLNATDIPQDFEITGLRDIEVPAGAESLVVTPIDWTWTDNLSASLRVSLEVIPE